MEIPDWTDLLNDCMQGVASTIRPRGIIPYIYLFFRFPPIVVQIFPDSPVFSGYTPDWKGVTLSARSIETTDRGQELTVSVNYLQTNSIKTRLQASNLKAENKHIRRDSWLTK